MEKSIAAHSLDSSAALRRFFFARQADAGSYFGDAALSST
jgi:hypothetical protein